MNCWRNFLGKKWKENVDTRDFILNNYTEYLGDESFLEAPTERTTKLWEKVLDLTEKERENGGVLEMDTEIISTITSHGPGYLDKDMEVIVGFQTDKPFKRSLQPFGGVRMAEGALETHGLELSDKVKEIFTKYRKTHNQAVFEVYTDEMRLARHTGIITGLPDAYGRGRIIGDYRRVALYGVDLLIEDKIKQKESIIGFFDEDTIRLREELSDQITALKDLIELGDMYGFDIRRPAENAKEAVQWTYFGYLAATKQQNGAAMSLGRVSTFLDIYIERDLREGTLTEKEVQELIDQFVMKLRLIKFARTPEYQELYSGDPTWVTESIGGMALDGRSLVTKNSFRFLHTLTNIGTAPEPNMTVLWSKDLPENFKRFCAKTSINTSSIQYENDDLMRPYHGDDYAIACCVSSMVVGKEMQFFGARANMAKALLYAINGGMDEKKKIQVGPKYRPITSEYLEYDEVMEKFDDMLTWLAELYVNTLNIIHYMHDKYSYESLQMALHDRDVKRYFATGIAGLSVVTDSLSAIKYAKVKAVRDEDGLVVDYEVEGDYPKYGNDDDRVDTIAQDLVTRFMNKIRNHKFYRDAIPTMSILTITSNIVYGKKTGNTPDGRRAGEPFAPGANPMHRRDEHGALASLSSVAKLPFKDAQDGISNTFSIIPNALGKDEVFMGDIDLELELCKNGACTSPTLEEFLDFKEEN
ncbi:formate C-acetyltransferase [Peptoniphilus sp.]|uniref:formate C-acetyltransferase n=1 Tax=Peptoniphilus sp. TaxID=1971214 RepID=UPI00399191D6